MAESKREEKDRNPAPPKLGGGSPGNTPADEDEDLNRLRALTNGGPEDPRKLEKEIFELDASTDEQVDALKVNLLQEDERSRAPGSGRVVDEIAEQTLARFTEVGPQDDRGAESVTPGRDDTSSMLRRRHPNTEIARAQDIVEGNLDEPREESRGERKVDEGTAA